MSGLTTEEEDYFASLHERHSTAESMTHRKASSPDWSPGRGRCHDNVDNYVKLNPHCTAIRGWMIMSEDADGQCLYEAHSVVEDADKLYDITLQDQAECDGIRFLRHHGPPEVFWAIERCHKQILYPCPTPDEQEEIMSEPLRN